MHRSWVYRALIGITLSLLPSAIANAAGVATTLDVAPYTLLCTGAPAAEGFGSCTTSFEVFLKGRGIKDRRLYVVCRLLTSVIYADDLSHVYPLVDDIANLIPLSAGTGHALFTNVLSRDAVHGAVVTALVDDIQCSAHR